VVVSETQGGDHVSRVEFVIPESRLSSRRLRRKPVTMIERTSDGKEIRIYSNDLYGRHPARLQSVRDPHGDVAGYSNWRTPTGPSSVSQPTSGQQQTILTGGTAESRHELLLASLLLSRSLPQAGGLG